MPCTRKNFGSKKVIINGDILIYILGTDSKMSILYRVSLVYRPPSCSFSNNHPHMKVHNYYKTVLRGGGHRNANCKTRVLATRWLSGDVGDVSEIALVHKLCSANWRPPCGFFRITSRVLVGFERLMVRWNGEEQALHVLLDLVKNI